MKIHLIKILLLVVLLTVTKIDSTNSYFSSGFVLGSNVFSTGCWAKPTSPQLVYPPNNSSADSLWDSNPYMDWADSSSSCPTAGTITYQYESAYDPLFAHIAYSSDWLVNTFIPAPSTPDNIYYWHVRSKDSLGNISEFSGPWKFTVNHYSLPAPQNLHWKNPQISCGGYTNSFTATATWDSIPGASSYLYEITYPKIGGGNGVWPNPLASPEYSGVFNQAEGLHTYHVYAIDSVGRTSPWSSNCSVTYDATDPTSTITLPVSSGTASEITPTLSSWNGQITGTAADNLSGIDHVELSIYQQGINKYWDGSDWVVGTESTIRVLAVGTTSWSYQIATASLFNGIFKIVSHAVDKAGNIENSATIEFEYNSNYVQTITPTITPVITPTLTTDINLLSNHSGNKINLEITNISSPLAYEILYTGNGVEKGISGHITADEIINSNYSKEFDLGTRSTYGTFVPENVEIGSTITVNLTNGVTLTKTFNY